MTKATTHIGGFTVTLEPNEDREGFQCWISCGRAWGSLALAEDLGEIDGCGDAAPVKLSDAVLDRIRSWAEARGY
jgi:hypothetical protein